MNVRTCDDTNGRSESVNRDEALGTGKEWCERGEGVGAATDREGALGAE